MEKIKCDILGAYPIQEANSEYKSIAYDNCYFYFLASDILEVHVYNLCLEKEVTIKITRAYSSICYDSKECCFWGCKDNYIYELNKSFEEKKIIYLDEKCGRINQIDYDYYEDKLLITLGYCIIQVDKNKENEIYIKNQFYQFIPNSIVTIETDYLCVSSNLSEQSLDLYSQDNCILLKCNIPNGYCIQDMVIRMTSYKKCCSYYIYALAFNSQCCMYLIQYEVAYCCEVEEEKKSCSKNCADLIESVALVEASLAHILNAEGEKIQKAVCISNNICDLLAVNKSINETLSNVRQLELILNSKLETIKDICEKDNYNCN
ncbi:MAG: hypothetical protein RSD26_03210 [Cellulosilyticaceae bacterium]